MPNKREGGPHHRGRENAAEKRGAALRTTKTRSSSAKLHSGIVDVAKKLLDTVHKLENDDEILTTTTTRKERGKRHTNSTAAEGKMMMMMKENQHQAAGKEGREWGDEEMRDAPTETMEEEEEENTKKKKKNNGTRRNEKEGKELPGPAAVPEALAGSTTPRNTIIVTIKIILPPPF